MEKMIFCNVTFALGILVAAHVLVSLLFLKEKQNPFHRIKHLLSTQTESKYDYYFLSFPLP